MSLIQNCFCLLQMEESPEPDISNTSVGILTIVNSTSPTHFSPVSAAAVVEDELVVGDIPKWLMHLSCCSDCFMSCIWTIQKTWLTHSSRNSWWALRMVNSWNHVFFASKTIFYCQSSTYRCWHYTAGKIQTVPLKLMARMTSCTKL